MSALSAATASFGMMRDWLATPQGQYVLSWEMAKHDMLLAEFDYDFNLKPSVPLLDPTKPHRSYWYMKKYGLPAMYWNLMLKGLA